MKSLSERVEDRNRRLQAAMFSLISNTNFGAFIELVDELREEAFAYAISNESVKDQRLTLAAMGEARALNDMVGIYKNYQAMLQMKVDEQTEGAENSA